MFGDETLKVWDLDTGRALRTLEGYSAEVSCVAVTADGKRAGGFRVWGQNAEGMGPGQRPAYTTSTASRRLPAHWDEQVSLPAIRSSSGQATVCPDLLEARPVVQMKTHLAISV